MLKNGEKIVCISNIISDGDRKHTINSITIGNVYTIISSDKVYEDNGIIYFITNDTNDNYWYDSFSFIPLKEYRRRVIEQVLL